MIKIIIWGIVIFVAFGIFYGVVINAVGSTAINIENSRTAADYSDTFNPQEIVYNNMIICMEVDTINKRWRINKGAVYEFDDLRDFEIVENWDKRTAKASTGPSMIGAALNISNATNTYIKEYSSMAIRISVKDLSIQDQYIHFESKDGGVFDNGTFENAQKCMSLLRKIKAYNDEQTGNNEKSQNNMSVADELGKLKALLDTGAITQEEFDVQKQKLFN